MKNRTLLVMALVLVLPLTGLFAAGANEETTTPQMDKIVYLSANLHDSEPEIRDAWAAEFKRITGVDIELKTVSSKDASEGMMIQFMAGEFPDVCKFGGDDLSGLARQEFILPIDDFIENSEMKKIADMFPSAFLKHSVGGEYYGVPEVAGAKRSMWVRTDILDELGIAMPTTLDEFVACLKKIRDEYPAPDGTQMYPYISKTYHSSYISGLSYYFDVAPEPIMRRPGETNFREGWDSPQFRDYAEFMKMLYDEHLIDPDHVLPQKASATRSKFFAGKGAFLMMHTHLYESLTTELQVNFPEAQIDLVPPIVNPKGGVMGSSITPGYRPFVIMSSTPDPQFVWDTVIETLYLNPEGVMLLSRGIPDVSYRIENGVLIDNFEESGVHMNARTPLNPFIEFPFKLAGLTQVAIDKENQFDRWLGEYDAYMSVEEPTVQNADYDMIAGDMADKKQELFWKYVLGDLTFERLTTEFENYKKEVGFADILKAINAEEANQ